MPQVFDDLAEDFENGGFIVRDEDETHVLPLPRARRAGRPRSTRIPYRGADFGRAPHTAPPWPSGHGREGPSALLTDTLLY